MSCLFHSRELRSLEERTSYSQGPFQNVNIILVIILSLVVAIEFTITSVRKPCILCNPHTHQNCRKLYFMEFCSWRKPFSSKMKMVSTNHRICWIGRDPSGLLSSNSWPWTGHPMNPTRCLRVLSKCLLSSGRAWCSDHFPGEPVPVPSYSLGEKLFPDTQPKPPWLSFVLFPRVLSLVMRVERCWRPRWGLPTVSSRLSKPSVLSHSS